MVAYLTIEKINEKLRGKEIPEKIALNKTYTTIGDMPHHDVRLPFSGSKAAYLSIHQDEEGNFFLTPYDIKIFINNTQLTESICLRDKDFIQITEDYTYCFNYIRPINVVKPAEPVNLQETSTSLHPLKPGKTAVLKKTARLEKMNRKDLESTLTAEILIPKIEEEKLQDSIKQEIQSEKTPEDRQQTKEGKDSIAINVNEVYSASDSLDDGILKQQNHSPSIEQNNDSQNNDSQNNPEISSENLNLNLEEQNLDEIKTVEKKVDLSLRDNRKVSNAFKKQKRVLRNTQDSQDRENQEKQEPEKTIDQADPIGTWKQTLQSLIETPGNIESEHQEVATPLENAQEVIHNWKETLEGLITETSPVNSTESKAAEDLTQEEAKADTEKTGSKDLIGTWKETLHSIMEQAKQAEETEFTPEDSRNLITNWKETLENLMNQAEQSPATPEEKMDEKPIPIQNKKREDSQKLALAADFVPEDNPEESLIAEEASREYSSIEEIEEEKESAKTDQTDHDEIPQYSNPEEKRGDTLTSWKEALQNLVEKNAKETKEKSVLSDSKTLLARIPQLKPPAASVDKMSKIKSALNESKSSEEQKSKEQSSLSESKKLRSLRKSELEASKTKRNAIESLRENESSMDYADEPEMTLMWDTDAPMEHAVQISPRLISPSSGEILSLEKDLIYIGRSVSCDMCLVDDYVSRQHLEFKKIPMGFIVKNIGKNDVFIEKRSPQNNVLEGKITLEQRTLKPAESTLLLQEATIIIGTQILYYFSGTDEKETSSEGQLHERKFNFYKNLANQKKELLDAAQLQKTLIPPKVIFEDIQIGVWFKYMAINDLSGDFFLYHREGNSLYFCLGDVSGHGAAAALMASQISGMFRILAEKQEDVEEIAQSINSNLFKAKRRTHNLYALVNILKVTSNGIQLCIAGNSVPPLYYNARENELISLDTPSTPTGLFTSGHFKTYLDALKFEKNDMLIMFTDGVTEAEMIDGSLLEYDRTQEYIQHQIQQNQPWEFFLDNFLVWLKQHCEIRDDLSIVLIGKLDR
ncbi:MAG: SpoIIE family protein phosphatase [Candidatus Brocadiae bacterium]|nr:SpoIIE family protein phosphatase [Candidatus Brocadiia bacterium]